MSKSYTPGLKILRNTIIRKERKLPLKGDINCSKANPPPTNKAGKASSEIIILLSMPAKITARQPKHP